MAEAVISDIAVGLISKLGSSVLKEIGLWWGLTDELDKLKRTISTIEVVLLHAEEQSMVNPQVKHWLGMLSEAMYDADDLLDDFSTEALRQQVMGGSKTAKKVRLFFSSSNQFAFGLKMAHKVKDLRERFDEIATNRKFHLEERSVGRVFLAKGGDKSHSAPPKVVIGRQTDQKQIVDLLLSSDYQENVSVVPIVGIGGLGKTTLAQVVYNDDSVKNHFELKMWVCVSNNFDVELLVKKILESATGETPNVTEMDPLKSRLHEKINGRKYLLVLDDVWNEDVRKWLSLTDLLAGGARGSKIVITTRLQKVAEMSRPIGVHELSGLSEDHAWSLFKQMAFKQEQVPNPSLEEIGKEIVAKCHGVPLAITVIGGMMYFKDLESEWLVFKKEELSKIDVYKNDILPILQLSYNYLPSHYKHCFAYCSLYPKDYEIPVEELIHLWKAQGYLKSNDCLQDVGFGCFMDLFQLSFFQEAKRDDFGNITTFKMHDLMHDLAVSVAGDNFSTSLFEVTSIKGKTQHISFSPSGKFMPRDFSLLMKKKKIRTVLALNKGERDWVKKREVNVFCDLKYLRSLHLFDVKFNKLPSSIYKLKHLRYLNLSYLSDSRGGIKELSDSIVNLQNLKVLILRGSSNLKELPDNITKLVNLTDLDNSNCLGLTRMPRGIGQLTQLEKLPLFVIAKQNNSIFGKQSGGLDELHALNNLRGSLEIKNLKYVKNPALEFKAANLNEKKLLQTLKLGWQGVGSNSDDVANDEMGLEALRPHQSLKELMLSGYRGVRHPSWLSLLTDLVSIELEDCKSIQWLPPFNQLPSLKKLSIQNLTNLERIDVAVNFENGGSSSFFPSLTHLTLWQCPNLKGFVRCDTGVVGTNPSSVAMEELPCFPRLFQLQVTGCPNLIYMPLFPELKKMALFGDDNIKWLIEGLKRATTSASKSTSSSFSTLSQLEDLQIQHLKDFLVDELLQYLPSLQNLEFFLCECKSVSSDDNDDVMLWQNLKVLQYVHLVGMRNLVSLPKGLQYVTTLQRMHIWQCPSLASIPEWMGNLNALQYLSINYCPKLSARCKNNTAEDWPNISHIPNITIDFQRIQRNGCYLL